MYAIYGLCDPRDGAVRYVGITNDVYRRFKEHIAGEGKNPSKDAWIEDLKVHQVVFIMRTLDTCTDYHQALALESEHVKRLLAEGAELFNLAGVVYTPPQKPVKVAGKLARYDGRSHLTQSEVGEVLDAYLTWGILPHDVSERQRRHYRNHPRLEERRRLLGLKEKKRPGRKKHQV